MKNHAACCVLYGLFVVILATNAGGIDFCSWWPKSPTGLICRRYEFKCSDGQKCIGRDLYCDNVAHCDDGSDEVYCPWFQYGRFDIKSGTELNLIAVNKVEDWIKGQKKQLSCTKKWGSNVDRLALILHAATFNFSGYSSHEKTEIAYELHIQMSSQLLRKKIKDIPSAELTSYVNAFTVMCINPRNFHGYDLVEELRDRTDQENYTNPYILLALCNAGQTITESDKRKLMETFWIKRRIIWTDMQAVAIMALVCANKQPGNEVDSEILRKMTQELKQQYNSKGSIDNFQTTALVMQALISAAPEKDPDNFDEIKAYQELLHNQKSDGSFGDLLSTFLVTPVLTCKSLVDFNSHHCHFESRDGSNTQSKTVNHTSMPYQE